MAQWRMQLGTVSRQACKDSTTAEVNYFRVGIMEDGPTLDEIHAEEKAAAAAAEVEEVDVSAAEASANYQKLMSQW